MTVRREAANWYEGARIDLMEAEDALQRGRPNWALFAAQQAVEKALKAAIIARQRRRPSRTHDLVELYREAKLKIASQRAAGIAELTPYYSVARYPNAGLERPWENISGNTARRLLHVAKRAVDEIGQKAGFR